MNFKNTGNESKNRQIELYKTKKLLHSKENNQKVKPAMYRMRENIRKAHVW